MSNIELLKGQAEALEMFQGLVERFVPEGARDEFQELFDNNTIDSDMFVHGLATLQRERVTKPGLYRELVNLCSLYGYSKANPGGLRFKNNTGNSPAASR